MMRFFGLRKYFRAQLIVIDELFFGRDRFCRRTNGHSRPRSNRICVSFAVVAVPICSDANRSWRAVIISIVDTFRQGLQAWLVARLY